MTPRGRLGVREFDISLVIPTYNERESVGPLVAALEQALEGLPWEALFVDDSTDGSEEVIADLARTRPHLRLVHRDENRGGLAGAVVEGLMLAQGAYLCVLDADLQHPPARIPEMLAQARTMGADVVIASRYIPGGSAGGLDGPLRRFYSLGLKRLSLMTFPRRLAGISDPLGGYFLLHRDVVQGVVLRPIGYKILLEILVRCQWQQFAEVPYRFEPRQHGTSKADFRQGVRFLQHLATLFWDCSPLVALPRLATQAPLPDASASAASRS